MKEMNKFLVLFAVVILSFCFVGCQEGSSAANDVSSGDKTSTNDNASSDDGVSSKVPVVIVDSEKENSSDTESKVEEIIDNWENTVPDINIEVDSSDDNSSDTTTSNNSSGDATSSEKEDNDVSKNESSTDVSSKEDETSKPARPDDGYFDVAV